MVRTHLVKEKNKVVERRVEVGCPRSGRETYQPLYGVQGRMPCARLTFNPESAQLSEMVVVEMGIDPEQAAIDRFHRGKEIGREGITCGTSS